MAVAPIPGVQKVEQLSAWPSPVAHLSEKLALPPTSLFVEFGTLALTSNLVYFCGATKFATCE